MLSLLALTVVLAVTGPLTWGHLLPVAAVGQLRTGFTSAAAALLIAAGVAYLIRWRLTGEASVALVGVAFLVLGTVLGLLVPLAPFLFGAEPSPMRSTPIVRCVTGLVAAGLLLRSLYSPPVDAAVRPGRLYVLATGTVLGIVGTAAFVEQGGDVLRFRALHVVLALSWLLAAVLFLDRAARGQQPDLLWIGVALLCLAAASLIRAAADGRSATELAAAAVIDAVAGAVALLGTTRHLSALLAVHGSERTSLHLALAFDRISREESLHDARSTLAALRCAAGTLQRYDGRLASSQRETLQTAVTSELVRLGRLIDPQERCEPQAFDLGPALAGVLETERSSGSEVAAEVDGVLAVGRPDDVAAIVHNLLVNARRYAPGTPVSVRALVVGGAVEVRVEDGGAGLDQDEAEAVFARGRRGALSSSADGSGLGLFVARRLATEMGGRLWVEDKLGAGACFVLQLPSALPEQQLHQVGEAREIAQHDGHDLPIGKHQFRRALSIVRQAYDVPGPRSGSCAADEQSVG